VLLVEIENRWHAPASGSMFAGLLEPTYHRNVVIDGMGTVADGIVREDDQTLNPTLQPRVPAVLAFSWVVPADAYRDGQTLTVLLKDAELLEGQMLFHGEYWSALEPAARPGDDRGCRGGGIAVRDRRRRRGRRHARVRVVRLGATPDGERPRGSLHRPGSGFHLGRGRNSASK
jgi:hypothetical protein